MAANPGGVDEELLRDTLRKFGYTEVSDEDIRRVEMRIAAMQVAENNPEENDGDDDEEEEDNDYGDEEPDESEFDQSGEVRMPVRSAPSRNVQETTYVTQSSQRPKSRDAELSQRPHVDRSSRDLTPRSSRVNSGGVTVNARGEYPHQQRFQPPRSNPARDRAELVPHSHPETISPRSDHPTDDPRASRPSTRSRNLSSRHDVATPRGNTVSASGRAPMNRHTSNVIYSFTDDRRFANSARGRGASYQPHRRSSTDVVKKGQQLRDQWDRDRFLSQRNRRQEIWEVRRNMLGGQTDPAP